MSIAMKRAAALAVVAMVAVVTAVVDAPSAFAVPVAEVTFSSNATLTDGEGRAIGGEWGNQAPYKVNFTCGLSGCANYVVSSTSTTNVLRWVEYDVCNAALTATHHISVWMKAGAGTEVSATAHTTWTATAFC